MKLEIMTSRRSVTGEPFDKPYPGEDICIVSENETESNFIEELKNRVSAAIHVTTVKLNDNKRLFIFSAVK